LALLISLVATLDDKERVKLASALFTKLPKGCCYEDFVLGLPNLGFFSGNLTLEAVAHKMRDFSWGRTAILSNKRTSFIRISQPSLDPSVIYLPVEIIEIITFRVPYDISETQLGIGCLFG